MFKYVHHNHIISNDYLSVSKWEGKKKWTKNEQKNEQKMNKKMNKKWTKNEAKKEPKTTLAKNNTYFAISPL